MHNYAKKTEARGEFWSSSNAYENISKWPLLKMSLLRFFVVIKRQFKPTKTLVLLRTLSRLFKGLPALKVLPKVHFLRRVRPNEVEVLSLLDNP